MIPQSRAAHSSSFRTDWLNDEVLGRIRALNQIANPERGSCAGHNPADS